MKKETASERVETLTDVPAERVQVVKESFRADGAVSVEAWEEPPKSDRFTVRAVFAME